MPETKFRSFRVEAVVLRHSDYGEADRLLTLYTRQLGKTRAIAKGARKIASRKAGHIEPFTQVKLQLAQGRDMLIVTQADTIDAYQPLREDLVLTGHASYVLELLDRFTYQDETENSALFRLLTDTLSRLAAQADPWLVIRYYEMRLRDHLGPRCGQGLRNITPISVETLKYLRHFQRSSYADASRARPGLDVQQEAETLMQGYFTYLLERELNTPGFLKSIRE
jgi:DNA repair protein RecO (recombination protein O)